jgi:hypothetical protein
MRDERGVALVMVLMVMAVLAAGATTAILASSSAGRTAAGSNARDTAYRAAEAGINAAMAVLNLPSNNALNPNLLPPPPPSASAQKTQLENSYVLWGGTLSGSSWTVTAIGYVANPTGPSTQGAAPLWRKLTATVTVIPTMTQPLNNPAWNYIYATKPPSSSCDETLENSVTIASPLYVSGNLCLQNTSTIVSGPLMVHGWLWNVNKQNGVGTASAPISDAHIANGCRYQNKSLDNPCKGSPDNVYASTLDSSATSVQAPTVYWDSWYQNASPGPYFPCQTSSGSVPVFDTSPPDGRNNTYGSMPFNLTPSTSYTCKNVNGELSWDASKKLLTVSGTIFIDGSAYIQNGAVNRYTGQATIYLSGTLLMKNSELCAGLNAGGTGCDVSSWDPNSALLAFVTNSQGGQVSSGDGVQLVSAYFQGAVYATYNVETDTTSGIDGPICGYQVILGQSVTTSFPTITTVPVGMPSNPTVYAQPQPPVISG